MQRGIVSLRPLERTAVFLLYDTADSGPGIIGAEPNVAYAGARNAANTTTAPIFRLALQYGPRSGGLPIIAHPACLLYFNVNTRKS